MMMICRELEDVDVIVQMPHINSVQFLQFRGLNCAFFLVFALMIYLVTVERLGE